MKEIRKFKLTEQEIALACAKYVVEKAGLLITPSTRTPVLLSLEPTQALDEMALTATVEVEAES